MTMTTIEYEIREEEVLLGDTRAALQLLREEIETLRENLACGDMQSAKGASAEIKALNVLFNAALETENRLGKTRNRQAGIAQNGVAFDLVEARASIGRKLDSLRNARDAA